MLEFQKSARDHFVPHFLNQKLVSTVKVIALLESTITTVHPN